MENNNKLHIYCVYDVEADLYDVPFFTKGDLFAKRKFIMDCEIRNKTTMIEVFKDSFELRKVGYFISSEGIFEIIPEPETIIKGTEVNNQ